MEKTESLTPSKAIKNASLWKCTRCNKYFTEHWAIEFKKYPPKFVKYQKIIIE